jgi:hypothetical protein
MLRVGLRGYPTNSISACCVNKNVTTIVDSRDILSVRYPPSRRRGDTFKENHQIDRRRDGATGKTRFPKLTRTALRLDALLE